MSNDYTQQDAQRDEIRARAIRGELTPQERYAVVEGQELADLYRKLGEAMYRERAVRFTVHNGLKIDAGNGWTAAMGRPANESGY